MEEVPEQAVQYRELGILADQLLEECEDDEALLAERLDALPGPPRDGLLSSDFLNAYQVFYYFFREVPDEIEMERLLLIPASELQYGTRINEIELLELIFAVIENEAFIFISDGDTILAKYSGSSAYRDSLRFIGSML